MLTIQYAPTFVRIYKGLDLRLKEEIKEKIELFQHEKNHEKLKVHKLSGRLRGRFAFSVNYKIRIVFNYENKKTASLLYVGSHDAAYE